LANVKSVRLRFAAISTSSSPACYLKLAILVFEALHGLPPRYLADDCQLITDAGRSHLCSSESATYCMYFHAPTPDSATVRFELPDHLSGLSSPPIFASLISL